MNNNTDPKVAEALRLIDLENLEKYYPLLQDIKQKHQILIELLRSACFEKTRKQVMKTSDRMLRDLTKLDDGYINSLIEFYSSKRFNAVTILSWSETIDFHKNRPEISTEEILEVKELDPSILVTKVEVEVKPTRHERKKKKHKGKKKKGDKADKDKDNDDEGGTTKKKGKDKGHEKKKSKEKGAAGDMKSGNRMNSFLKPFTKPRFNNKMELFGGSTLKKQKKKNFNLNLYHAIHLTIISFALKN